MSINKKPISISLNDAEKRIISIAAKLDHKHFSPYVRDVVLNDAKKLIADHEKNNAPLEKKNALRKAIKEVDAE